MDAEKYRLYLRGLLWLFVIHTTAVAIGLIILPTKCLIYFGLEGCQERFFQTQAGVFHLVMGVVYLLALFHGEKQYWLIYFAIIAKSIAVIFLLLYYLLMEPVLTILFSAVGDGVLGLMLLLVYKRLRANLIE